MNRLKNRAGAVTTLLAVLALCVAAGAATNGHPANINPAAAQSAAAPRPDVRITMSGTVARPKDGVTTETPAESAGTIRRGETIRWTVSWVNKGEAAANNFKTTAAITPGTRLLPDTIKLPEGATVTFSIDGGKTYSASPQVSVRQPGGGVKNEPAPVESYDHIRFESPSRVAPGTGASATFEVRVK